MSKQTPPLREPAESTPRARSSRVLFAVVAKFLQARATGVFFYTRERIRVSLAVALLIAITLPLFAVGVLVKPDTAVAATASTLNFQARLQSSAGAISPDGGYNIQFKLYDAPSGGTALWTETYLVSAGKGVNTRNGYLSTSLGSVTPFSTNINWGQQLYLTMNIGGTESTPDWDGEMNPRLSLTSVPSAFSINSYNSNTGYTGSLKVGQMTGGNQRFTVPDQGAPGDYTLLTTQAASTAFIQNTSNVQSGVSFNIGGNGQIGGGLTVNGATTLNNELSVSGWTTLSGGVTVEDGLNVTNTEGPALRVIGMGYSGDIVQFSNTSGNSTVAFNDNGRLSVMDGSGNGLGFTTNEMSSSSDLLLSVGGQYDVAAGSIDLQVAQAAGNVTISTDAGERLFAADATNNRIVVGNATGSGNNTTALVLDSGASDPTGVNGAMYYNTANNVFRCFVGGAWVNCDTQGSGGGGATNGATIASGSGGTGGVFTKFNSSGELANTNLSESLTTLQYAGNALINAASDFNGNLLDLQINNTSKLSVNQNGNITLAGNSIAATGALTVSAGGSNQALTLQGSGSGGIILNGDTNIAGALSTGGTTRITSSGTLQNVKFGTTSGVLYTDTSGNIANLSVAGQTNKCLGYDGSALTWLTCSAGGGSSGGWSLSGDNNAGSVLGVNAASSANFVISSRPNNAGATSANASYISFSGDQYSNANRITISGNSNFNSAQGGGSWQANNNKDYFRIQDSNGNVAFAVQGSSAQQQVFMYLAAGSSVGVQSRVCSTLAANGSGMATIATCNNTGTDLAESYNSTQNLEAGEIVATDPGNYPNVLRSTTPGQDNLVGIVSTDPDTVMGTGKTPSGYPIALNGRVPTKVNGEGGVIHPGDKITSSSVAGVGKRATERGMIVGTALTGFDGNGQGTIEVFVHLSYYEPTAVDTLQAQTGLLGDLNVSGQATITNLTVTGLATVNDLQIGGHLITAGNAPQIQVLGNAGKDATATITGNDVGGTIALTTGTSGTPQEGNVLAAGGMVTVTFNKPYTAVPRVMITADDGTSAQMGVFPMQRTMNGFTLSLNALPNPSSTYTFTYFVTQ